MVTISSTGDTGLSCECSFSPTKTAWRAVTGASKSSKCQASRKPLHEAHEQGPETNLRHETLGPAALRPLLRARAAKFCRELQAKLWDRVLLVVDARELVESKSTASACWQRASHYLGKQHIAASLAANPERVRLPRAQITSDIKFGMQTIALMQSMLVAMGRSMEMEATTSAHFISLPRFAKQLPRLYKLAGTDSLKEEERLHSRLKSLKATIAHYDAEKLPLPLAVQINCDPNTTEVVHYQDLVSLLHSQTAALTPESANITLVSRAFAQFTLHFGSCIQPVLRSMTAYSQCMLASKPVSIISSVPVYKHNDRTSQLEKFAFCLRLGTPRGWHPWITPTMQYRRHSTFWKRW